MTPNGRVVQLSNVQNLIPTAFQQNNTGSIVNIGRISNNMNMNQSDTAHHQNINHNQQQQQQPLQAVAIQNINNINYITISNGIMIPLSHFS